MSAPLHLFLGWRCFAILVSPLNMYYIFSFITEMTHPPKHQTFHNPLRYCITLRQLIFQSICTLVIFLTSFRYSREFIILLIMSQTKKFHFLKFHFASPASKADVKSSISSSVVVFPSYLTVCTSLEKTGPSELTGSSSYQSDIHRSSIDQQLLEIKLKLFSIHDCHTKPRESLHPIYFVQQVKEHQKAPPKNGTTLGLTVLSNYAGIKAKTNLTKEWFP